MEEKEWLPKVPLELSGRHETGIIMTVLALRNKTISLGNLAKADTWGRAFADQGPRTEFPRKGLQKTQRGSRLGRAQESSIFILPLYFPGSTLSKVKVMELTLPESCRLRFSPWRLSDCRVTNRSPQVSVDRNPRTSHDPPSQTLPKSA